MATRADPAVEVAAVVTDESSVTHVHDVVDDDTALVVVPATMDDAAATSESNQRKKVNYQRRALSGEARACSRGGECTMSLFFGGVNL